MSTPMTDEQLAAIEARAAAATAGPWSYDRESCVWGYGGTFRRWAHDPATERDRPRVVLRLNLNFKDGGDLAFIAHARTDVPALAAEVRSLRAALAEQRRKFRENLGWILMAELNASRGMDAVRSLCDAMDAEDKR